MLVLVIPGMSLDQSHKGSPLEFGYVLTRFVTAKTVCFTIIGLKMLTTDGLQKLVARVAHSKDPFRYRRKKCGQSSAKRKIFSSSSTSGGRSSVTVSQTLSRSISK